MNRKKEMVKNVSNSVVTEPSDVPFIACVEEDGPTIIIPELVGNQVALLECQLSVKPKMIHLETVAAEIILLWWNWPRCKRRTCYEH